MSQHRARKRFGQHFLHDPRVIDRIVNAVNPQPGDTVLEIGPGLGALTTPLLRRHGRLHAVEVDRDVIDHLRREIAPAGELDIHERDALRFRLDELGAGPFRVVGNLPYNISTPLLFHLFAQRSHIHDMHFMLQKEVVDRMVSREGSADYGRLSIMTALFCDATWLFDVPPGAFTPRPRVQSAVLRLVPRTTPLCRPDCEDRLADIVRQAFSKRRKTLRNALKGLITPETMERLGIDPTARPETLSPDAFSRLAESGE